MKVKILRKSWCLVVNDKPRFAIGVMCGERWYWRRSWKNYSLFWKLKGSWGFGIGPILIWDGT